MVDKFYHQQPCFCIPCRVMKAEGIKAPNRVDPVEKEKPKKPRKAKKS